MNSKTTIACLGTTALFASAAHAQLDLTWNTIDGGGGTSTGGTFVLSMTIGQPDAGDLSGGTLVLAGGFWAAQAGGPVPCYANCDGSTGSPALTANDFQCFVNSYAAGCT